MQLETHIKKVFFSGRTTKQKKTFSSKEKIDEKNMND